MRDLSQKSSDIDKRIAKRCCKQIASRHSIWLTYLLTLGTISAGGLSFFSIATLLKTNPAQANEKQTATNPAQVEESGNAISLYSNEATSLEEHQILKQEPSKIDNQTSSTLEQKNSNTNNQIISTLEQKPQAIVAQSPTAKLPTFTAQNQSAETEFKFAPEATVPALNTVKSSLPQLTVSEPTPAFEPFQAPLPDTSKPVERLSQLPSEPKPTPAFEAFKAPLPDSSKPVERLSQLSSEPKTNPLLPSQTSDSEVYKSPGSAALLGGTLQAQSARDTPQQTQPRLETTTQYINPLAPTLFFQGVVINQGDTSARARLTGLYPISPNALFGGTAEVGTGPDFSDPQSGSFRINELYFTGNLPSYPNLRLTAGLVDLTSYFDRNSFAKDAATQFFNPVFQTNPALSATGIASRPAVLLNWNITDNIEAKAAGFSSAESIGDIGLDAFVGELGFRAGNGIVRATYATDRDVERNGFKEIYGIQRSPGEIGPRSSDRESSYGINGEYFFPEIKMGVFGRYGRYENTSIGRGGDTYSVGLNFLDLFMRDDRLGFGYGRNLSNDELRRQTGAKIPDVLELFYDVRLSPILRAAVTLQERNQFTETVVGFRIKTEFDVSSVLGKVFR
ncbi:MAG: porin [Coleofasciculaceae cyanobacterium]